jgi:hypothetical protein
VASLWNRPVLESGRVDVVPLDHPAAEVVHNLEGPVGGAGIGYEDFVGDAANRFDALADVSAFVFAGDEDGELWNGADVRVRGSGLGARGSGGRGSCRAAVFRRPGGVVESTAAGQC